MGKIAMKAVQQQVFNLGKSGGKSLAYVLRPSRYSTIDEKQIVEYCTQNSMVPKAYISASMVALAQCFSNFLVNGHHVVFPGLGTFSLTSTGYAEGNVDKAGLDQLKKLNVRFLPCKELKSLVDGVDVELDGIFDIAGETIVVEATDTTDAKTQKYYKRVTRTVTADADGNTDNTPTPPSSTTPIYTLTVKANNDNYGTVEGSGEYAENASATLKATAKSGYEFKQWSDGNTAATRVVTVVADKTYTATFSMKQSDEEGTI